MESADIGGRHFDALLARSIAAEFHKTSGVSNLSDIPFSFISITHRTIPFPRLLHFNLFKIPVTQLFPLEFGFFEILPTVFYSPSFSHRV